MSDKRDKAQNNSIGGESEADLKRRKRRIATLRYKVYTFILAVFLFGFWPTFLNPIEKIRGEGAFELNIMNPIDGAFHNRGNGGVLQDIDNKQKQIEEVKQKIERVELQAEVIDKLQDQKKQNTIINCLNLGDCEEIEPELMEKIDLLRVFIIVDRLQSEKMEFSQQQVLRNLHEYITNFGRNGVIKSISFGDPTVVDEDFRLNKVPITLTVEYENDTKEKILKFLDNIENKVFTNLRVMYVINNMNYIIPQYDSAQNVSITLTAYYFDGLQEPEDVGESQ